MKNESKFWKPMEDNVVLGERVRKGLLMFLFWTHIMAMFGFLLGFMGLCGKDEVEKYRKEQAKKSEVKP